MPDHWGSLAAVVRLARAHAHAAMSVACVVFFAWFAMRFFMDTANDSETLAYSALLFANAFRGGASVDGTGHATLFAQYVLALFAQILQPITVTYYIHAHVTGQLACDLLRIAHST